MADTHHACRSHALPVRTRRRQPTFQSYEVPLRKDWMVLDALNYIKDQIDGTLVVPLVVPDGRLRQLRHDGQRRAEADLRRVPHRLRARARSASSRSRNFPVVRDLVVDIDDFMRSCQSVKPWIIREEEKPVDDGEYLQTPERAGRTTSSSACASTACSATRPARSTAWTRSSSGRPRSRWPQRYNLDSRDQGARERLDVLIEHEGIWGCTFVGECTRVCPKHVDPAGAIQRYKLKAAQQSVKAFLLPEGCAMTDLTYRRPVSTWWWLRKRTYFVFVMRELSSIFIAWFVLSPAAVRPRGRPRHDGVRGLPRLGRLALVVVLNVVAFVFVLLHTVTWFSLTPQAMDVRIAWHPRPGVPRSSPRSTSGWPWCPAFVFWLVMS